MIAWIKQKIDGRPQTFETGQLDAVKTASIPKYTSVPIIPYAVVLHRNTLKYIYIYINVYMYIYIALTQTLIYMIAYSMTIYVFLCLHAESAA